jgi:hypothetical protein
VSAQHARRYLPSRYSLRIVGKNVRDTGGDEAIFDGGRARLVSDKSQYDFLAGESDRIKSTLLY